MYKILQDIINCTNIEITKRRNKPVEDLTSYGRLSFKQRILNPKTGDIGLIAEIKLASPTTGKLGNKTDLLNRLLDYQTAGADAISVITENKIFKGSPDLVTTIKKSVSELPILQKDFVVDDFQIKESCLLGADALLLIAGVIDLHTLRRFVKLCRRKKLEPIVEICNPEDLVKAIACKTEVIAVNARNLDTLEVNIDKACQLLKQVPDKFIKLGFSGIHSRLDVQKYKQAGAKAILVGTALMKTDNISKLIKELKNAG